ncbi:MAG: flagellar motor switch protein FliM, partial [Selenomonadaceae bacterium]
MGEDVLSQSEIDKLLSAISTGAVSAEEVRDAEEQKKVKVYDFKRPDKFSKDQIRTLYMLHENFARLLNTYLSTHLRTMVNVEVASVEQLTYEEFVRSLSNPSVIGVLAVPPLKGNVIMEINPSIAFAIIDRLFGGTGESAMKVRVLTEIEEAVMRKIMNAAISGFKDAWENVINISPQLEAMETNPQFTQIVPPSDMVVIITLQVRVGNVEGLMNICIPYLVLEPIMSKLTTTFWVAASVANKEDHPEQIEVLQRKIRNTSVQVAIELGSIDITIQEFLTLGFGDV